VLACLGRSDSCNVCFRLKIVWRPCLTLFRWSLVQFQRLTFPFPSLIPLTTITLALIALVVIWLDDTKALPSQDEARSVILVFLAYIIHLIPVILTVWSATYVFSTDIRACRTELQWKRWFQSKNEDAIRSVQSLCHCCGLNSMRDRAWPFPSHNVDATTCERTSGFSTACGPIWQEKLRATVTVSMTASILELLLLVRASKSSWPGILLIES